VATLHLCQVGGVKWWREVGGAVQSPAGSENAAAARPVLRRAVTP